MKYQLAVHKETAYMEKLAVRGVAGSGSCDRGFYQAKGGALQGEFLLAFWPCKWQTDFQYGPCCDHVLYIQPGTTLCRNILRLGTVSTCGNCGDFLSFDDAV